MMNDSKIINSAIGSGGKSGLEGMGKMQIISDRTAGFSVKIEPQSKAVFVIKHKMECWR
jgi:hypothetical protein